MGQSVICLTGNMEGLGGKRGDMSIFVNVRKETTERERRKPQERNYDGVKCDVNYLGSKIILWITLPRNKHYTKAGGTTFSKMLSNIHSFKT